MIELKILPTEDSPGIEYDSVTNTLNMFGDSRPENTGTFYKPVINWIIDLNNHLDTLKSQSAALTKFNFIFKYYYFNSTSAKYIAEIFKNLKVLSNNGHDINIEWHYDHRDDDMLDSGKEFADLFDLKIEFISY